MSRCSGAKCAGRRVWFFVIPNFFKKGSNRMNVRLAQNSPSIIRKHLPVVALGFAIAFVGATAALAQSSTGSPGSAGAAGSSGMSPGGSSSTMPPATSRGSGAAPATGGASPSATTRQPSDSEIAAQFKVADADGDGKLSKEEAKTGMPGVYRNFERIDTKGSGFVTQEDLTLALKR
jgi:EF hand